MNDKTKRKFTGQMLYVILAILVLSIVCIAIAVSFTGADQATPTTPPPTTEAPQTQPPQTQNPQPKPLVFSLPLQGVVSRIHADDTLVFCPTMEDYRTHTGLDITANLGTAVTAAADGVIKHIYTDPFMGVTVVIDHGQGMQSMYQNLSETLAQGLQEGLQVKAGDVIGAVGESAGYEIAQEPHLHFELLKNNESVDPLSYLPYETEFE